MNQETEKIGMNEVEYFDLYNSIKGLVGDRDVAMVILQEIAKDNRAAQIRRERLQRDKGPATDRQKAYLRKLGVDFGPEITFKQASRLIDEALGREA